MKQIKLLAALALSALIVTACGPKRDDLQKQIDDLSQSISTIDIATADSNATQLVRLCVQYADAFPDDSITPYHLLRAGEIALNLGKTDTAILIFDRIIQSYDNFQDLPLAYFLEGQAYENSEDYQNARNTYEEYLELFPNHYLAEDTRKILPYLGMPTEKILDTILSQTHDAPDATLAEK